MQTNQKKQKKHPNFLETIDWYLLVSPSMSKQNDLYKYCPQNSFGCISTESQPQTPPSFNDGFKRSTLAEVFSQVKLYGVSPLYGILHGVPLADWQLVSW